jgi:hypothetical protein
MSPHLIADVTLYSASEGRRTVDALPGWSCPCCLSKSSPLVGWDGYPLLHEPLSPGDWRRVGVVFLSGDEVAKMFREAGIFYLWEGPVVGEAVEVAASHVG